MIIQKKCIKSEEPKLKGLSRPFLSFSGDFWDWFFGGFWGGFIIRFLGGFSVGFFGPFGEGDDCKNCINYVEWYYKDIAN